MRDNGVDMPDPEANGGRLALKLPQGPDKVKFDKALKACGSFGPGGERGRQIPQEDQEKILAYVRCMRDNGIDLPRPGLLRRRRHPDRRPRQQDQAG